MSYSASVIAFAFVKKGISEGNFLTQMKLQKVVFFAHGYHLARYDEPLIKETFEAWKFGPVVPGIYQDFKFFGSRPITDAHLSLLVPRYLENQQLGAQAQDALDYTWNATKDIDAIVLSNWTHQPSSPWTKVYRPGDWSTPISNTAIKVFFEKLLIPN